MITSIAHHLAESRRRTTLASCGFRSRSASQRFWNFLPNYIKLAISFSSFRSLLKVQSMTEWWQVELCDPIKYKVCLSVWDCHFNYQVLVPLHCIFNIQNKFQLLISLRVKYLQWMKSEVATTFLYSDLYFLSDHQLTYVLESVQDNDFDNSTGFLQSTMNRVTAMAKAGHHCYLLYLFLFACFVFFVCWLIIKTQ